MMNVVDSSGWLEYFADGANADYFAQPLQDRKALLVPTICLFEVFKVVLRERGEDAALQAAALMKQGTIVGLDANIALQAAKLSHDLRLPMADSIIQTTARMHRALVWTQDEHFKDLPDVRYFPRS